MCKNTRTTECTGNCDNCGEATIHAPDAHKRFEKLKHAIDERGQPVVLKEPAPICNK